MSLLPAKEKVPLCQTCRGARVSMRVPAKRRRALLASNPIEEYPAGTHRGR